MNEAALFLADGSHMNGHSFGAKKSIAGECVFSSGIFFSPFK